MNTQTFIVVVIIFAACFYIGQIGWRKIKSLSSKSACGAACGCATPLKKHE